MTKTVITSDKAPAAMFAEQVTIDGVLRPRFEKCADAIPASPSF